MTESEDLAAGAAAHRLPVTFSGSGSEYFRIWIVNLLLTIVTLGLYYPFAKLRRLRYFHGATAVGGSPLSFHGNPWAMLRGHLLVGAMMVSYGVASAMSPTAGAVALLIVAALWPALWHSALRFRLANTAWRGLRLRFTGTRGGSYAAFLWVIGPGLAAIALLVGALFAFGRGGTPAQPLPVLGVLLPLLPLLLVLVGLPTLQWRLRRYQNGHLALGAEHTHFSARLRSFFRVFALVFGAAFVMLLAVGVWVAILGIAPQARGASPTPPELPLLSLLLLWLATVFGVLLTRALFTAQMQNLVWRHTASQHLRFVSTLSTSAMLRLALVNGLLLVCTLGLYYPFAAIATMRLRLQAVTVCAAIDPDELAAQAAAADEAAAGDAAGDMLGLDLGL